MIVSVLDSGIGNVGSVVNALVHLGAEPRVIASAGELRAAERVVFPGVGNFGAAVERLHARELVGPLREVASRARAGEGPPLLGVCVGMQLFFEGSAESPGAAGLGVYRGTCARFAARKVPHMGWNSLRPLAAARALAVPDGAMAYFVHSYFARTAGDAAALLCEYEGEPFVAGVEERRLAGVQFHLEKSGDVGLAMLRRWLEQT